MRRCKRSPRPKGLGQIHSHPAATSMASSGGGEAASYGCLMGGKAGCYGTACPAAKSLLWLGKGGGRTWARTKDPLIKSQLLYQLSYASIPGMQGAVGDCAAAFGGARLAKLWRLANPKMRAPHQRCLRRLSRSIDIRMPKQIMKVICAVPPKLISGSGTPTTGASPITIAMLIAA
jgi:hypothetical protein